MANEERPQSSIRAKSVDSVEPQEWEKYLAVPAWRVWTRGIFEKDAYRNAADEVEANELALRSSQFDRGEAKRLYNILLGMHHRVHHIPSIFGRGSFDLPSFVLEPLNEDQVGRIDEDGQAPGPLGSVDKPDELLRPDTFKGALGLH